MDRIPEEVVLHVLSFLEIPDIVIFQAVSHRYCTLSRDNTLWKTACFNHSRAEALRRRQQLISAQDARIAELRNAFSALPGGNLSALDVGNAQPHASSDAQAEAQVQRHRALVNWEPGYQHERIDYYEEYIHRHAPISLGWLRLPKHSLSDKEVEPEATGMATLTDDDHGRPGHVIAPLDDGSVCIWDISARSNAMLGGKGRLLGQSRRGLLSGRPADATSENHLTMTETGAVESIAVDSSSRKAYVAVQNKLQEVDLSSMELVSTKHYPFPITALSEANGAAPLTVGTNMTVHLYDPRDPAFTSGDTASEGELIGGSLYSHATLAQPGPLSILHQDGVGSNNSSIWVAGRFTSLLNYDRRFFPRLRTTMHSGARIASLAFLHSPLIPRSLDLVRNPTASISALMEARAQPGTTILAAAEYKGKGSLELYGLPKEPETEYQNRQTASASKLLSATPHGARIVFSDGDGNLKWVERDGFSHVRTFNIGDRRPEQGALDASAYGIWSSTASEMPGQGDIVQKIIPIQPNAIPVVGDKRGRSDVNQSNLLLWTGDGALGVLGFGHGNPLGEDVEWHDAPEEQAGSVEEMEYGMAMRRALERNADEVRFVRGLGMGGLR